MLRKLFYAETMKRRDVTLAAGQYLRLREAAGWHVTVVTGSALATCYDLPEDVALTTALSLTIPNDGLVLIEAVSACQLHLLVSDRAVSVSVKNARRMRLGRAFRREAV